MLQSFILKYNKDYYSLTSLNNILQKGEVVYNTDTDQCYYYNGEKLILLGDYYNES